MKIDDKTKEIINNLKIDDTAKTVTITQQLNRKQYQIVNELLTTCGGVWTRGKKAHVFTVSPSQALKVLFNGDSVTTTVETAKESKKKHQAFFTPPELADYIVEQVAWCKPERILEPSAGNGSLVKAIQRMWNDAKIDVCEIQTPLHKELLAIPNVNIVGKDFLEYADRPSVKAGWKYDLIVMNPPFSQPIHSDITHIQHAYTMLDNDGVLISIMGLHSFNCSHKADIAFREWFKEVEGEYYDIEAGAFQSSGTSIATRYIIIRK